MDIPELDISGDAFVACDGRRLIVLRNSGTKLAPSLEVTHEVTRSDEPNRNLATDRPGRLDAPASGPRSAVEQTDFHKQEERAFLRAIADALAKSAQAGKLRSLVIAAPPTALGILRGHYTKAVSALLLAELNHDVVKEPVAQLESRYKDAVAP